MAPPDWTWLIYMAGDNDLRAQTDADLVEIEKANPANVNVVVQLDLPSKDGQRLVLNGNKMLQELSRFPNPNSGDPAVLTDFLKSMRKQFPSKRSVLVLWDHGAGWMNFTKEQLGLAGDVNRTAAKAIATSRTAFFKKSISENVERSRTLNFLDIIIDLPSHSSLSNQDLQNALTKAIDGGQKFDIIGCDACWMNMIEVAHQIRDCGDILVGSEDEEQVDGWPFDGMLKNFDNSLSVDGAAEAMVAAYKNATTKNPFQTLSALRLGTNIDNVATALQKLGQELVKVIATQMGTIKRARAKTHVFSNIFFIDLQHFVEMLKTELTATLPQNDAALQPILTAAGGVINAIKAAVIITSNEPANGDPPTNIHGISVYLPDAAIDPGYKNLSLAVAAPKWAEFVAAYAAA